MSRTTNSKKPGNKPPCWFKRMRRQADRAKTNQALREEKEVLPERRKNDQWDWT